MFESGSEYMYMKYECLNEYYKDWKCTVNKNDSLHIQSAGLNRRINAC